jgi:calcineurin-like phosphoesterase family protein
MSTWFTADWHLGDNRMDVMGRPFKTTNDMIQTMIKNHNELVSPEDTVIVVGDVCYQKTPEYLPFVEQFNGRKTLVRGNHDRVFTDEQLKPYFIEIIPDGDGINMEAWGVECYITHYPTRGISSAFNIVGHIHAAWKYQLNMFNVGVDANHYKPVDSDSIPFHLKAISDYYDEDVWVAYNKLNSEFKGLRGKSGTYFQSLKNNPPVA